MCGSLNLHTELSDIFQIKQCKFVVVSCFYCNMKSFYVISGIFALKTKFITPINNFQELKELLPNVQKGGGHC